MASGGREESMKWFKALALVALVASLLTPVLIPNNALASNKGVDTAPLMKLLQDTITALLSNEFSKAVNLSEFALNISLPPNIRYLHTEAYGRLIKLAELMNSTEEIIHNESANPSKIKVVAYELYALKLGLSNYLNQYVQELSRGLRGSELRESLTNSTAMEVKALSSRVDELIRQLSMKYLQKVTTHKLLVGVEAPEKVLGGSEYSLIVSVEASEPIKSANITAAVTYGNELTQIINITTHSLRKPAVLRLKAPAYDKLIPSATKEGLNLTAVAYVMVEASTSNGTELLNYSIRNFTITYLKPPIKVELPQYIHVNDSLTIMIYSCLNESINATLYLDRVGKKNELRNLTIVPGKNTLAIPAKELRVGYHKIILVTHAIGPYLGMKYSAPIAVVGNSVQVTVKAPNIVSGPPFTARAEVRVNTSAQYRVKALVDGAPYLNKTVVGEPSVTIGLTIPSTILVGKHTLTIEVVSLKPEAPEVREELTIYTTNLPALVIASAVIAGLIATPPVYRGLTSGPKRLVSFGFGGGRRGKSKPSSRVRPSGTPGGFGEESTITSGGFRRPKLLTLYRELLSIISKHVSPPKPSETLREFTSRAGSKLVAWVRELVEGFIRLYERDLYSREGVSDEVEAESMIRRLREVEGE